MPKKSNVLYAREVAREIERVVSKKNNSSIYWATVCGKETSYGRPIKVWPRKFIPRYRLTNECGEGVRLIISNGDDELIRIKLLTCMNNALEFDLPAVQNFVAEIDYEKLISNQ